MIIAGTGSRSYIHSQETVDRINNLLQRQLQKDPDLQVMSGMAEGWDEEIAMSAIELGIPFIAAIPHPTYGQYYWSAAHSISGIDRQDEFIALCDQAEEVVVVSEKLYVGKVHANFVRNQYMVDRADGFYVWNPTSRGTADCVRRIVTAGKPYKVISPEEAS